MRVISEDEIVLIAGLTEGEDPPTPAPPSPPDGPAAGPTREKPEQPDGKTPPLPPDPGAGEGKPPTIYGHELAGLRTTTQGCFEPVQAVWQDDAFFGDKPGKQLTERAPNQWTAELKMVVDKPTLLFGPRKEIADFQAHAEIVFSGTTNGTGLIPVKFRFTLTDSTGEHQIWEEAKANNSVPLDGPFGTMDSFHATLSTKKGIPPDSSFTIAPGPYGIKGELVRENGDPTGIVVYVEGEAIQTNGPRTYFVPVAFSDGGHAKDTALLKDAEDLCNASSAEIPNYFPLKAGGLETGVRKEIFDAELPQSTPLGILDQILTLLQSEHDYILAKLEADLAAIGKLGQWDRVVAVVAKDDFPIFGISSPPRADSAAFTPLASVIVAGEDVNHFTVAHELIHTLPYLWSDDQMNTEFGFSYHNGGLGAVCAEGFDVRDRIYYGFNINITEAVMYSASPKKWITQGSYWHLLDPLSKPFPDPDLLLVRGIVARDTKRNQYAAMLRPFYEFTGTGNLTAGGLGELKVVVRDAGGGVLAEYAFTPVWRPVDLNHTLPVAAFSHSIENRPDIAEIELVGPTGVLAKHAIPRQPPQVRILSPTPGETLKVHQGRVPIHWHASSPSGRPLLASVFYSPDGGNFWYDKLFERDSTSLDMPLEPLNHQPVVKVVVTDGGRSSQAIAAFRLTV
jgi:hypothetical protein